jgi:hypothetical protein
MKKNSSSFFFILLFSLFLLAGCGKNATLIPLSDQTFNKAGDVVTNAAGHTADAAVAKQRDVMNAHNLRTSAIFKAHKVSGFKTGWISVERTVFYPGMKEPIVVKEPQMTMAYTPPIEFDQHLPMEPAIHPVWGTVNNITDKTFGFAKFWTGGYFANSIVKNVMDRSAPQYNGDYTADSYNATAEPYMYVIAPEAEVPEEVGESIEDEVLTEVDDEVFTE